MKIDFYLSLLLISIFLSSCETVDLNKNISVKDFEEKSIDFAKKSGKTDTIPLFLNEGQTVSEVKRIFVNDSVLFVLDEMNRITKFSLATGKVIRQIHNIGHSNAEYIDLISMSLDEKCLHLLDFESKKILKYDMNLNFISSFYIETQPMDFIAIEDGYLVSAIDASDGDNRIIHLDSVGKIIGRHLPTQSLPMNVISTKTFNGGSASTISVHDYNSKDIYTWSNNGLQLKYNLQFVDYKTNTEAIEIKECFILDDYVVFSFYYDDKSYYGIYSTSSLSQMSKAKLACALPWRENATEKTKTNDLLVGYFDPNSGVPFYPMGQTPTSLMGLFHADSLTGLKNWRPKNVEDADLVLFVYHFKI